MKIQLIYPPLVPGEKPRYGLQPLGVLYLATYLQRHGIEAGVIDGEIEGLTVDEIVQRIAASGTDLVGISAMTPQLPVAFAIAQKIKSLDRGIRNIIAERRRIFPRGSLPRGGKLKLAGFDQSRWIKKAFREFYFRPRFILKAMGEILCNPSYLRVGLGLLPKLTSFVVHKKR